VISNYGKKLSGRSRHNPEDKEILNAQTEINWLCGIL
jgi:hypothetical protein